MIEKKLLDNFQQINDAQVIILKKAILKTIASHTKLSTTSVNNCRLRVESRKTCYLLTVFVDNREFRLVLTNERNPNVQCMSTIVIKPLIVNKQKDQRRSLPLKFDENVALIYGNNGHFAVKNVDGPSDKPCVSRTSAE